MAEQPPSSPEQAHRVIGSMEELRSSLLEVVAGSRREIILLSHALDPILYNHAECSKGLFDLVRRNHHCRIRILIADLNGIRHKGHHLLTLAHRAPSFIEIRLQSLRYRSERREWLICDTRSVLYREQAGHDYGVYARDDRRWAIELSHQFEDMWRVAEPHPDLRRLSI